MRWNKDSLLASCHDLNRILHLIPHERSRPVNLSSTEGMLAIAVWLIRILVMIARILLSTFL